MEGTRDGAVDDGCTGGLGRMEAQGITWLLHTLHGGSKPPTHSQFHFHTFRFRCNVCGMLNEIPVEYFCNLDQNGRRKDLDERPEMSQGTVEYVAPAGEKDGEGGGGWWSRGGGQAGGWGGDGQGRA